MSLALDDDYAQAMGMSRWLFAHGLIWLLGRLLFAVIVPIALPLGLPHLGFNDFGSGFVAAIVAACWAYATWPRLAPRRARGGGWRLS